jgi:hypothetical protein
MVHRPFLAILFPDRGVPREVAAGRYGVALLSIVIAAAIAAAAISARLDLRHEVLAENASVASAKVVAADPKKAREVKTDREIDEQVAQRTAVKRVMLGLDAAIWQPLRVLFLALGLFLLGRYVGGTPTMARALSAAALVALPGAIRSLVTAVAAWSQPAIGSKDIDQLTASAAIPIPAGHPALAQLLGGVDVFTLWSAVILGFALAAAGELKPTRAAVASFVGFALYVLVTGAIMSAPQGASG